MPRDWIRDERGRRDFGQADYSHDYAYDPERRTGYRAADETDRTDDYGQADYSTDYVYDAERGRAYRRDAEGRPDRPAPAHPDRVYGQRMDAGDYRRGPDVGERGRSWVDRAGAFFSGHEAPPAARRRRGPSDRVLWAIIVERLEDARSLDLRDVEVLVDDAEVTLNGTVRRKEDKRRIEDIADLDEVRHVQNNLRVRDGGRRWFG
jgi:hypothetical protein